MDGVVGILRDLLQAVVDFNSYYRGAFRAIASVAEYLRGGLVGWLALAGFLILTLPRHARGIATFFENMMSKHPLPAYRQGGITDANIAATRKLLFFFTLLLLYQLVQVPLTFGNNSRLAFWADLAVQVALLATLFISYRALKLRIVGKLPDGKRKRMKDWLSTRLEGIGIRIGDMRKIAVTLVVVSFAPFVLQNLPQLMSLAASWARGIIQMLPASPH